MQMELLVIGLVLMSKLIMAISTADEIIHDFEESSAEYCYSEAFQPRCLKNEVILMKSSTYGRMRIGRCITAKEVEKLGSHYLGCSADVLAQLDPRCSGKSECDVRVAEISVDNIEPCTSGLRFHLEASYVCINIADERRSCAVDVSTTPIHIVGSRTCGTKSQPWIIEAPVGQKIRVSLIAFSASDSDHAASVRAQQSCRSYGLVVDKTGKRNVTICATDIQREKSLYLTAGNVADLILNSTADRNVLDGRFVIIKLQAVGCSDIIPPEDAYLKRNDDVIVVGCYSSRKSWHLQCEDGKWIGVIGNCSQGSDMLSSPAESEHETSTLSNEQILVVMALGGITLTVCVAIICFGAVCWRRYHSSSKMKLEYKTLQSNTRSQPIGRGIHHTLPTNGTGNDARDMITSQMPTYSVFVGDRDLNDSNTSSIGLNNSNASAPLG